MQVVSAYRHCVARMWLADLAYRLVNDVKSSNMPPEMLHMSTL